MAVPDVAIDERKGGVRRGAAGHYAGKICVEHFDEVNVEGAADFKDYARRLGMRDSALAFVRMQIELRLARPRTAPIP